MIKVIAFLLCWIIGSTALLWLLYAVSSTLTKHASGTKWAPPVLFLYQAFWIIDVAYNLLTGSLIFWEAPLNEGETFSVRLRRHYYGPNGWRRLLAALFRAPVNHVEPGHI
jgi:hypothetical protein